MKRIRSIFRGTMAAMVVCCGLVACDNEGTGHTQPADSGDGADSDSSDPSDSETEGSAVECNGDYVYGAENCPGIAWNTLIYGDTLALGDIADNWTQTGYIDCDLNGVVEQEVVEFDFCYIRHTGKQSIVITGGVPG